MADTSGPAWADTEASAGDVGLDSTAADRVAWLGPLPASNHPTTWSASAVGETGSGSLRSMSAAIGYDEDVPKAGWRPGCVMRAANGCSDESGQEQSCRRFLVIHRLCAPVWHRALRGCQSCEFRNLAAAGRSCGADPGNPDDAVRCNGVGVG